MSATAVSTDVVLASWDEPAGTTPRGTLLVIPGRGETSAEYARFGKRISSENWKVRLVSLDLADLDVTGTAVEELLADESLPSPKVLLGVDAGATWVARAADGTTADAVIVTGAALPSSTAVVDWDAEIDARSACPVHRNVLAQDEDRLRGALNAPLPADWRTAVPATTKPALVIHGDADPVTSLTEAFSSWRGAANARLKVVRGGRHDVVNDAVHRVVAATIVLFLESVRLGPEVPAIVEDLTLEGQRT